MVPTEKAILRWAYHQKRLLLEPKIFGSSAKGVLFVGFWEPKNFNRFFYELTCTIPHILKIVMTANDIMGWTPKGKGRRYTFAGQELLDSVPNTYG